MLHFNVWQLKKHLENNGSRSSQASFSSAEGWSLYKILLEWISLFLSGEKACWSLHEECKLSIKYYLRIIICNFPCPQQTLSCLLNLVSQSIAITCSRGICLFSPWCSLCCGKCPPFGSFYPFLAHSATKMVPVSVILSLPCSLPPPNVLNSRLLSLLHIWFSDSGISKNNLPQMNGSKAEKSLKMIAS